METRFVVRCERLVVFLLVCAGVLSLGAHPSTADDASTTAATPSTTAAPVTPAAAPVAPASAPTSAAAAAAAPAPTVVAPAATPSASTAVVGENTVVKLEYQLHGEDGALIDSTDGKAPFEYTHGRGQIVPGLERQLVGLHVGESKQVIVKPEEAYGQVNPAATEEIDRAQLPQGVEPKAGLVLRGTDPEGHVFRAIIKEVKEKTVVLDLNHPLAGKTLTFQVKIVDVQPATATP